MQRTVIEFDEFSFNFNLNWRRKHFSNKIANNYFSCISVSDLSITDQGYWLSSNTLFYI